MSSEPMSLRIFDQDSRRVKAHGLIVENGRGESGEEVAFQIGAGVGDQGKAGGVGFRKTVERERSDGLDDTILGFAGDAIFGHAGAQLAFHFFHAFFRAFETEGAA